MGKFPANASGGGGDVTTAEIMDVLPQVSHLNAPPSGGTDVGSPTVTAVLLPQPGYRIVCTGGGAPQLRYRYWALPGGTTVIKARLRWTTVQGGAAGIFLALTESATGKIAVVGIGGSGPGLVAFAYRWTDATTPAAQIGSATGAFGLGNLPLWVRFTIAAGNLTAAWSVDDQQYEPLGTVALTTAFTVAPNRYAIAVNGEGASASYSVGGIFDSLGTA